MGKWGGEIEWDRKLTQAWEEKKRSRPINGTARESLKLARRRKEDLRERVLEGSYLGRFAHGRYSWSTRCKRCQKTAPKGAQNGSHCPGNERCAVDRCHLVHCEGRGGLRRSSKGNQILFRTKAI